MRTESVAESVWWWSGVGFFGLCALVSAWLLIRPQILILDDRGFKIAGGLVLSPQQVLWRDIRGFFVCRLPFGGEMIGFNFEAAAKERSTLARISRSIGAEGALPQGWPRSAEEMVEDLNAYRLRALSRTSESF